MSKNGNLNIEYNIARTINHITKNIKLFYECVLQLYTRYPIVARRAWPAGLPLGRVRRASKGILHTSPTALKLTIAIDVFLNADSEISHMS